MEIEERGRIQDRAVLVGLNADCFTKEQTATEETLEELEALLETAGGFCTAKVLQNRHTPDAHSFIGEGKAQEVRMLAQATESTMVIFDNELSPGNIRALEEIIGVPGFASWAMSLFTTAICSSRLGSAASMTWSKRSAYSSSSKVA